MLSSAFSPSTRLPTPESQLSSSDSVEHELVQDCPVSEPLSCTTKPSRISMSSCCVNQCVWLRTCITELKKQVFPKLANPFTGGRLSFAADFVFNSFVKLAGVDCEKTLLFHQKRNLKNSNENVPFLNLVGYLGLPLWHRIRFDSFSSREVF